VAFEREAIPWIDDVYRFALSLTRDESDADDVVQDTFLRAFRSWHTYMPGSDCRRWLFTICRNVFLRSRERARPTVELDATEVDAATVGSLYSVAVKDGVTGAPLLADALAWIECRLWERYDAGDHSIFVGEVVAVDEGEPGPGLVYREHGYHAV